jgi:prepilin-type N-terminal cleavage/methylation domain-containing protein
MIVRTRADFDLRKCRISRPGFSLLEVLIALAIFLISLIALGQLLTISGERAYEVSAKLHERFL